MHQASWFNYSPGYSTVHLVNSLLVGVTNPGYYSGVSVGIESSGAGVFEPVGAGGHYLQLGSPHRNLGTSSIDGGLATRLKRLTTYAPVVLTGPITQNTMLEPQAWRDVDEPDRGFHYEPLDYAVNTLQVQNATLTLTNGVVLATYGQNGLWLNSGAVLRSVGRPTERNHIVRFNTVMEQPLNWGGGGIDSHLAINPYHASGTAPVVECRFTDFALLAYAGSHLYTQSAGWVIGQLVLRDCGLRGGNVTLGGPGATAVELKNSLWQAVSASFFGAGSLQAHHNLFRRGYLVLDGSSGPWVMRDNVFDRCEIWDWSAVTHSHNAYVSTAGRIGVPQTGDQTLGSLTYYSRDLGRYYQHLASSLRNAGSRPVTAAGLAHYTTTSDYSKDTGLVDIGLHYVATTNGQPIDTDSDGLPDYVEDANGNLQVDPGETDWTDPDTGGTGISDAGKAAGLTPQTPCLLYSLHHPHQVGVWSQGQDLQRNSQVLLVERGTDALRIRVYVQTTQTPPSWYADFNDELTYRIESPLLEEAISGSYHIAQLGQAWWIDVVPETWMVCHDKTRETGSYLKVTVTSRNVNYTPPDAASQIVVFLSALRIDFSPILGPAADDRLVFDNQYPTGVLSVPLYAAVRPNEQPAFDYLEGRVKFEVDAVGDSELKWENENGGLGIHDPSSGAFRNLAEFRMLPTSNSAFGPKTAGLVVEELWGLDSQQQFRVFYGAEDQNWPGIPAPPDWWEPGLLDGSRPVNYFYYYLQTDAGIPQTTHGPFYKGGSSQTELQFPYKYFVGRTLLPSSARPAPGVNAGQMLRYIDLFAYAARHEFAHHSNYHRFWGSAGWQKPNNNDTDEDYLPDDQELSLADEAGPYWPGHKDTYSPAGPIVDPNDTQPDDGERHNCNSWFAVEWPQERQDESWEWDWARPGKNWPVQ